MKRPRRKPVPPSDEWSITYLPASPSELEQGVRCTGLCGSKGKGKTRAFYVMGSRGSEFVVLLQRNGEVEPAPAALETVIMNLLPSRYR